MGTAIQDEKEEGRQQVMGQQVMGQQVSLVSRHGRWQTWIQYVVAHAHTLPTTHLPTTTVQYYTLLAYYSTTTSGRLGDDPYSTPPCRSSRLRHDVKWLQKSLERVVNA